MNAQVILRKLVEMAGGPAEEGYILALDAEGLEEVPEVFPTERGSYSVHRPQTELGLRRLVWKANGAPFVALIKRDLATRLPPDLIRRARAAKVLALTLTEILGLALGVQVMGTDDAGVERLAIEHLEALRRVVGQRTLPTVVDQRLLDELLLETIVGQRIREATPAELLAGWLRDPPRYDEPVRRLVGRNLPPLKGAEGRILAWALGEPRRLEALIVRGALLAVEGPVPRGLWGSLWEAAGDEEIGLDEHTLRRSLVKLAAGALDDLGGEAERFVTAAESEARRLLTGPQLEGHRLLPLGLASRCAAVARALQAGEAVSEGEIQGLREHRAAAGKRREIDVLEELARLSRWLAEQEGAGAAAGGGDVASLIRAYRTDGAFADLAATRLQRALAASEEFHAEARALLARYRARRNAMNRAFAERLAADYEGALNNPEACPLHRVFNWFALPAVGDDGLYLVVLDGCSYPVFLELIGELAQEPTRPIGLAYDDPAKDVRRAGLALLPSVTSHSRGALFLGQIPNDPLVAETVWRDERERVTDPARFAQNPALGARSRRLFLKGDLADGGQALTAALDDGGIDVVAAVFNAVDDQIGSKNTGVTVSIRAHEIKGLVPSLKRALSARRRVLVTADHGHSAFVGTELKRGAKGPARFVELGDGQVAPEGFIEVDVGELGGAGGRRAFAWEMGAYCGTPHVAYHGGCGLEELVVPLAWLVERGGMAQEPAWWFGQQGLAPAKRVAVPTEPAGEAARAKLAGGGEAGPQLELFNRAGAVAARASQVGIVGLPPAVEATLGDEERAALVLLENNGEARATELGKALGKPAGRVPGFMTRLNQRLHRLGVTRFEAVRMPSGEHRYVYLPPDDPGGDEP